MGECGRETSSGLIMTPQTLSAALQIPIALATPWADPLSAAMALYAIDSPPRQAAFLAQCGHECGRFQWLRELWGPTSAQRAYEPPAAKAAELGNTQAGDGFRFRGGGLLQITGRYNFRVMGQKIGVDLEGNPDQIVQPSIAAEASAQFWADRALSAFADAGDFLSISRAINLGNPRSTATPNGMPDRLALWNSCRAALGVAI
ncbi:glycoside hydrolase family 19 protein [Burkholderia vietnamiensis]|nr:MULTISPECIES: glycoside hydrolase family 19 protein [Burkholderia]MDN7429043.1 glycoside hydrolase family 19 protein [Burkholderia sp. AU45388]MDN7553170.1 glycoside hydrolase family 19 protein [Burkholderia vietnamiensis]